MKIKKVMILIIACFTAAISSVPLLRGEEEGPSQAAARAEHIQQLKKQAVDSRAAAKSARDAANEAARKRRTSFHLLADLEAVFRKIFKLVAKAEVKNDPPDQDMLNKLADAAEAKAAAAEQAAYDAQMEAARIQDAADAKAHEIHFILPPRTGGC